MLSKLRRRKSTEPELPPEEDPLAEFDSDFDGGPAMGFFDHIEELRTRLLRAGLALIICTGIAIVFTGQILGYLIVPYEERLQIVGPTESVVVYFRVALMCGAIFSMPVITWQLFGFIMPGLNRKEKRWVLTALPGAVLFFLMGVAFAWFIMTPAALHFLANFQSDVFFVEWTADAYIAFVTSLLFWIGAAFETQIIFFVLARLGMVGPRALIRN
jgi:sec-independent protein translocase protein TatC